MAQDWQKLHTVCRSNVTRGMLAWLAEHLGVSIESLEALQVGWAPVVQFAKNKGYGFWTIPMRDATAKITGLSLRSMDDSKFMYPGSKPACFYPVNPQHRQGERGYVPGAYNWTRTSPELECPICFKHDGCLVADTAAICIRKMGPRQMDLGWLHITKPEGNFSTATVLPPSDHPVFTVEGFSDTCTLFDLGFVAVGRPSNVGGMDILADLIRGRAVVVVGENDRKADGKWPGEFGAIAATQTCRRVTHSVEMTMPPPDIKDVRQWKSSHNLTAEALLEYVQSHTRDNLERTTLVDDKAITIARGFVRDKYELGTRSILRRWAGDWYTYDTARARYIKIAEEAVTQAFYSWSSDKTYSLKEGSELAELKATSNMFTSVKQAALADVLVSSRYIPVWINGVSGPDAKDLIVFNNGILDVPTFLAGKEDYLLETTPDFFATTALPIAFDPTAACPTWRDFLGSSLGDDPTTHLLLQEWMGYCMTPDVSMQKLMYLRGVTGSGKSRVMEVIEALVGADQSVTTTFSDISGPFGVAPLVGKLACLIWDARAGVASTAQTIRGLEVLLNISGDDGVQVNRKFKEALDQHLTARITIASNGLISLPDTAGASLRRLNIIEFNRSFANNPDTTLPAKLKAEIAGIANWALEGLRRLRENGKFTVPDSSVSAMEEWRVTTNPIASFLLECTEADPDESESRDELYACWVGWAKEKRQVHVSKTEFWNAVPMQAPGVRTEAEPAGERNRVMYRGIKIVQDIARRYIGRP